MRESLSLGKIGEMVAANYLLSKKWRILEKNWFNQKGYRIGELDLIAENCQGEVIFVEIKTRKGEAGKVVPGENLNPAKLKKILKIAQTFLSFKKWQNRKWRVDLVEVTVDFKKRKFSLHHIKAIHF